MPLAGVFIDKTAIKFIVKIKYWSGLLIGV
jgi:hypothetical protein